VTEELYKNQAKSVIARALAVLGAFDVEHPLAHAQPACPSRRFAVATVYRLAGELEDGRFLDRDGAGRYGLGVRLWEMGLLTARSRRIA